MDGNEENNANITEETDQQISNLTGKAGNAVRDFGKGVYEGGQQAINSGFASANKKNLNSEDSELPTPKKSNLAETNPQGNGMPAGNNKNQEKKDGLNKKDDGLNKKGGNKNKPKDGDKKKKPFSSILGKDKDKSRENGLGSGIKKLFGKDKKQEGALAKGLKEKWKALPLVLKVKIIIAGAIVLLFFILVIYLFMPMIATNIAIHSIVEPFVCDMVDPLPDNSWTVSSGYGWRVLEIDGEEEYNFHKGIDLAAPEGTKVYAVQPGTVVEVDTEGTTDLGKYIIIDHNKDNQYQYKDEKTYKTVYGHLSDINVKEGDLVTKQTLIGYVGSTGKSTGSHLHFEVIENDKNISMNKYFGYENPKTECMNESLMDTAYNSIINDADKYKVTFIREVEDEENSETDSLEPQIIIDPHAPGGFIVIDPITGESTPGSSSGTTATKDPKEIVKECSVLPDPIDREIGINSYCKTGCMGSLPAISYTNATGISYYSIVSTSEYQCVWYAIGRANEVLELSNAGKQWTLTSDAKNFCEIGEQQGFAVSYDINNPQPGAIIVWNFSDSPGGVSNGKAGHVGVIESVEGDTVNYSHSWYDLKGAVSYGSLVGIENINTQNGIKSSNYNSYYSFKCYVYLTDCEENNTSYASETMLINQKDKLPVGFAPAISNTYKGYKFISTVYTAFMDMRNACEAEEAGDMIDTLASAYRPIDGVSQYPSISGENTNGWYDKAGQYMSEHHAGLAIDFEINNYEFSRSKTYEWLQANAHKYGFIERYTEDNKYFTNYAREAWHWRYIGTEHATKYKEGDYKSYEQYYCENIDDTKISCNSEIYCQDVTNSQNVVLQKMQCADGSQSWKWTKK